MVVVRDVVVCTLAVTVVITAGIFDVDSFHRDTAYDPLKSAGFGTWHSPAPTSSARKW